MNRKWFTLFLIVFLLIAGCTTVEELSATGTSWTVTESLMEYKYVKTGSIRVGKVSISIYGYRWKVVNSANNTGYDANPVISSPFDCKHEAPVEPEKGDQYCDRKTQYFLHFDTLTVEVSQSVWSTYTSGRKYKVKKELGHTSVVP